MLEHELIERFFLRPVKAQNIKLGIGDDAAILLAHQPLAVTCDTLVAGTHFVADTDPYFLGRKALAVNLSDLAAMGAVPAYALLALAIPDIQSKWLEEFARGFWSLSDEYQLELIGGDLVYSARATITLTAFGHLPDSPLRQDGAFVDDDLWLSGSIGAALAQLRSDCPASHNSTLHNPAPRVGLGRQLASCASAAIDLSDGLCAATLALSRKSQVGLEIEAKQVPISSALKLKKGIGRFEDAICGGEDYELLFTAAKKHRQTIANFATEQISINRIGRVIKREQVVAKLNDQVIDFASLEAKVYQHFAKSKTDLPADLLSLAHTLGTLLKESNNKLAVAESCTGGMLASYLTEPSGSSMWFEGGFVTYSSTSKNKYLDVSLELISRAGVVSTTVAEAMVRGVLASVNTATAAIAVTGWAGPGAGENQSAGTVCIGWAANSQISSQQYFFSGNRHTIRVQAVRVAMQEMCLRLK